MYLFSQSKILASHVKIRVCRVRADAEEKKKQIHSPTATQIRTEIRDTIHALPYQITYATNTQQIHINTSRIFGVQWFQVQWRMV